MFDFPASPTVGQQVTTPARVVFTWDGSKWFSNNPPPSLDVDFTTAIPAGFTFSRSSPASYVDPTTGNVVDYASGAPRFIPGKGLLLEPTAKNCHSNPRLSGAVVGTPGTLPTGWSHNGAGGVSVAVVGTGVENGMEYVDIRLSTASTAASSWQMFMDGTTTCAIGGTATAANGETLCCDTWYVKTVGTPNWGPLLTSTNFRLGNNPYNSSGTSITNAINTFTTVPNSVDPLTSQVFQRRSNLAAGAFYTRPCMIISNMGAGLAFDVTLRLGHIQCEVGPALYTSPIRTPTTAPVTGGITRASDSLVGSLGSWFNPRYISCAVSFTDARPISAGGRSAPLCSFDDGTGNATTYILPQNFWQLLENSGGGWYTEAIINAVQDVQWPNDGGGIFQPGNAGAICVSGTPGAFARTSSNLLAQGSLGGVTLSTGFDPSKYIRIVFNEAPNMYTWYQAGTPWPTTIPANVQRFLRKFRYYPRMLSPYECHDIAVAMA